MPQVHPGQVIRKISRRIIPFLFLLYIVSYIDRTNVSFAALQMNQDIGLTPAMFGVGAGLFFIAMCPFEVPSNLMMVRFGARLWLTRIMLVWGVVTLCTSMIVGPKSFYVMRLLLGISEAGFFPGVLYYLSFWFPAEYRTRIIARFMISLPVAAAVGAPISSFILQAFNGVAGLPGWRWLFLVEGAPAVLLGFVAYRLLIDRPAQARWLSTDERDWLTGTLDAEAKLSTHKDGLRAALVTMLDWRTLLVTFTGVCFVIGFYGTGFWLPQIIKTFHVPTLEIGLLTALPNLLGAIAMLGWGQLSRGRSTPLRYVVLPLLLAGAALLMAAHLLQTPVLAMVAFCVAMIGLYACMPAYWALPSFFFGGASTAVALAFINAVSNLGGFFGPALMGWLTGTTHSFALATAMLGGFVIVGALALLGLAPAFAHRPAPVALHSS